MAKIHVMAGGTNNVYTVVVHTATPGGNNTVGTSWVDAIKNSGRNSSVMTVGTGAGQIASAEHAEIVAGTVIEGVFQWGDDPAWDNAQRQADVDTRATQLVNELLARLALELKYFGYVRN